MSLAGSGTLILPGEACDDAAAESVLRRLRALEGTVLFFHDPVAMQSMKLAP